MGPSTSTTSRAAAQEKSTTKEPNGCCRRNFQPSSLFVSAPATRSLRQWSAPPSSVAPPPSFAAAKPARSPTVVTPPLPPWERGPVERAEGSAHSLLPALRRSKHDLFPRAGSNH